MHIVSRKALRLFWESHPESKAPLSRWFKIVRHTDFDNIDELRATFPSADKVGSLIVFNIGGNKYRLVASIHFNRAKGYIRHVLTHREYDKGVWKR
ncbi:MAG: type II toxin-antitoxin system HigB family toxin [Anaerolineales bacterium]